MDGTNTIDTKFYQKTGVGVFAEVAGLLEVPELGGAPERIDTTTLSDRTKRSIPGVVDQGDLAFKFLYDNSGPDSNYRVLKGYQQADTVASYKVEYPDGTAHEFDAYVAVKMDSAAVNGKLTFTASFMLQSDVATTDPV